MLATKMQEFEFLVCKFFEGESSFMAQPYSALSTEEIKGKLEKFYQLYKIYQGEDLKLDMSRGKPCTQQLDLSMGMYKVLEDTRDFFSEDGFDCRNYGILDGVPEAKRLFGELMGVPEEQLFIGGNSSLNLMYDALAKFMLLGNARSERPWCREEKVKFICPVPGYDRHFGICEELGIEMINVDMLPDGPDMDAVEALVAQDASIKGMWSVPMYSNPEGTTYSAETVRRLAAMKPAAPDFVLMWDNAYMVHHLEKERRDSLPNILDVCAEYGSEDMPLVFTSTSKISLPGSGLAIMAGSRRTMAYMKKRILAQTIGPDKINQLRHVRFFKDVDGIMAHMEKHAAIIRPKFELVDTMLHRHLDGRGIGRWSKPYGGYFISFFTLDGCAKRVEQLCGDCGVKLTAVGATYPYGKDPHDANIRIAPTYPSLEELQKAMEIFCLAVKIASLEQAARERLAA